MKKQHHWQDFVNLILGICAFLSPWLIGHQSGVAVISSYVIVGILISFFAISALIAFKPWEEWVNIVLGAWLLVSPWVLGFAAITALMWSAVLIGALVIICAGLSLGEQRVGKQVTR